MRRLSKAPSAASNSSTGLRSAIATVAMSVVVLALFASPAFGAFTHDYETSFGSTNDGYASNNVTVDDDGNVYVINGSGVNKYDESGSPSNFSALGSNTLGSFDFKHGLRSQVAVDGSGGVNDGNVYVATEPDDLQAFKSSGAPANFSASAPYINGNALTGTPDTAFTYVCGATVDSSGTIYVSDAYTGVNVFAPSGQYLTTVPGADICVAAVDPAGNLYVAGFYGGVGRYVPDSFPITASTSYGARTDLADASGVNSIAVDSTDSNVYGAESNGFVVQWASAAEDNAVVGKFGFADLVSTLNGIAVDSSGGAHDGSVYVADEGVINRFGPKLIVATLLVQDATAVTPQTATLNGTVSAAGGPATSCQFRYVSEADFQASGFSTGQTAPCSPPGPFTGSGTEGVTSNLTGLQAGTTYRFRLESTSINATTTSENLSFTTVPAVKEVLATAATNVTATSATLNGTINPGGIALSDCKFEYGLTEALGTTVPCAETPGSIGSGEAPVSVHADVSGLSANIYHYRLVASNSIGTTKSDEATVAIPGAPVILGQSVSSESFRAVFKATINPSNSATSYRVEYGTTTAYGLSTEEEAIVGGNDPVKVVQEARELAPATTYHYRVIAINGVAEVKGADQTFMTDTVVSASCPNAQIRAEQGSITLPECRAYEQVSPEDKLGKGVFPALNGLTSTVVSADGSAASFQSQGAFADAASGTVVNNYVSRRQSNGWSTHQVASNKYLGGTQPMLSAAGFSADLSRAVVFATGEPSAPLAPGAGPGEIDLFLNDLSDNSFRAVTLDPGPGAFPGNIGPFRYVGGSNDLSTVVFEDDATHTANAPVGPLNPYTWHDGQQQLVSILPNGEPAAQGAAIGGGAFGARRNAISDDASRIFFRTPDGRLYVRKNGTSTVEVSASQKAVPDAHQDATFNMATPDGRYVIFGTAEQLLDGDTDFGMDLYRFDVDTGALIKIGDDGGEVVGVSDDGSYIYFSTGSLLLWHNGQVDPVANGYSRGEVSPSGEAIAFKSTQSEQPEGEEPSSGQVYLYNAVTDTLECASCRRDGKEPTGFAAVPTESAEYCFLCETPVLDVNFLSNDGRRVFFDSSEPLQAADTNEKVDAYEYVNGRQYLLSSGQSNYDSTFANASPSGNEAFFNTLEPLVRRDGDNSLDLYVARVNGGFSEPPPEVPCTGETCRGGSTSPSREGSAGSAQFSGPGNADQRAAQKKAKKKKQKKKARNKKKAKKRASKSKGASKRSVGK